MTSEVVWIDTGAEKLLYLMIMGFHNEANKLRLSNLLQSQEIDIWEFHLPRSKIFNFLHLFNTPYCDS